VALLVGGPVSGAGLKPAQAHQLGRTVSRMVAERGGAVLATTSRRTGSEATDALAAGLGRTLNLLYRWGEPGDNPYAGFLATADAIVVSADSVSMISEACATAAPVFVAMPELAGARHRRLVSSLVRARQVRLLDDDFSPWPRTPLDEAGRVAGEILRRFPLD
jgi:mitochondrial fission protein ELM1